jgi:hypothetical protein
MKFRFFHLLLFLFTISSLAQQSQMWKGYFSYNEIVDVTDGENTINAATAVSLFYKNLTLGDVNLITSINDFKPEEITCIYHSKEHKKTLAGNSNGLLLVVNSEGNVVNKVDIIEEVPVPPNKKKINHFYEYNGKVYLATDYGISVFNLQTLEFDVTYFIGPSGEEVEVLQTTVFNDEIYAVTRNNGIRKADLNNPFLYDFNQWQTFDSGYWTGIVTFNNQLVAQNSNARTYRYDGISFVEILNTIQAAVKFKTVEDHLIITTPNRVFVVATSFNLIANIASIPDYNVIFSAATVVDNQLFIGTEKSGLFSTSLANPTVFENMTPNGPLQNYMFRIKQAPNKTWVVYGDFTQQFNPYPLDELGISFYTAENGWTTYPYEELLTAKSISDITVNPTNANQIYFSSFFSGLLKLESDVFTLYDYTNTGPNGLESLILPGNPSYKDVRINAPRFDREGNLWVTNSWVERSLKVLRTNGQWQSYDFSPYITSGNYRFGDLEIDKNMTKWVASSHDGLIAFNETLGNKFIKISTDEGLPTINVRSLAIDNNNQLWIGTFAGLRILSSVNRFLQENELTVTNIVIQEGDLAQELFYEQPIQDIEVDGSNRKWVSVLGAGVFLVSPNGQQTIYQFDRSNSPLPSNNVNDIEINGTTGEVFFATDKGMVSFLGVSTKPSDDLADVYVYPNPVRPNYTGTIKISGLMDKCNVKITDIEGNLVYETTSAGGTIEWDGTAFRKHKVASGVYMVFVASQDGLETTVKKIMVIR